ncbi:MAG TPA: hypothetical protein VH253_19640 [Phycisphaerae bacterium]|nr:hypothetical protein [Phycisphaerae bacterium]
MMQGHLHLIVEPKLDTFNHITKVDLIILDLARCDNEHVLHIRPLPRTLRD